MYRARVLLLATTIAFASLSAPATAAPQLNLTSVTCTITKIDNKTYQYVASGSYTAASSSSVDYKVNSYKAELRNNGGQQFQSVPLTSVSPTSVLNVPLFNGTTDFNTASSLKDVRFWVYNGGSQKGYAALDCKRVGWR